MSAARLATLRQRARIVLTIEALAIAALIPLGVIAAFLIITLLGAGGWQTDLIALAGLIAALIHASRGYRKPHPAAIDRRIEHDSRLPHRPIAAFEDRPILTEATLWQAHRTRIDAAIGTARVALPSPDLAAHDPYALRALLLLALIAAGIAAGPHAGARLAASLALPRLTPVAVTPQAWITPPGWTGEAPRLATPGPAPIHALTGASLSIILTGAGSARPAAWIAGHPLRFATIARGSYRATIPLTTPTATTPTTIIIGRFWNRIARYHLIVTAPTPPTIGFTTPPTPDADGKRTDLGWAATTGYGLSRLTLRFRPIAAPQASPGVAAIPHHTTTKGDARLTLLASPYAGLPVTARLIATNRAGLIGSSGPAIVTLPAPILHNRTAQAIEAIRRGLALTPQARPALAAALTTIAASPPAPITPGTKTALAAFAAAFAVRTPAAAHPEAKLWTLVERAEQGAAFRAAQRLAAASHALDQAMRQALAGKSPAAAQLQKLLSRLAAAAQAHAQAQDQAQQAPANAQQMQMSAISQLAQQIAREAAAGQTAQAKRDLAKLRAMLKQLQNARPASAAQQARQQAAQQGAAALSKLMRQESHLMDRTAQPNTPPPMGNQAGQQPSPQSQALARQQQALEQKLEQAAQALAQAGLKTGPQLGQGQQAMQGAKAQLEMGNRPGAVPAERAAIAALQQAQGALQAMQTGHGTGGGPSGLGQRASGGHGEFGNQNHSTLSLGRAGAHSDARTIQNQLIRRDAQPNLPPPAHQYYHRLLGTQF